MFHEYIFAQLTLFSNTTPPTKQNNSQAQDKQNKPKFNQNFEITNSLDQMATAAKVPNFLS